MAWFGSLHALPVGSLVLLAAAIGRSVHPIWLRSFPGELSPFRALAIAEGWLLCPCHAHARAADAAALEVDDAIQRLAPRERERAAGEAAAYAARVVVAGTIGQPEGPFERTAWLWATRSVHALEETEAMAPGEALDRARHLAIAAALRGPKGLVGP